MICMLWNAIQSRSLFQSTTSGPNIHPKRCHLSASITRTGRVASDLTQSMVTIPDLSNLCSGSLHLSFLANASFRAKLILTSTRAELALRRRRDRALAFPRHCMADHVSPGVKAPQELKGRVHNLLLSSFLRSHRACLAGALSSVHWQSATSEYITKAAVKLTNALQT